MYKRLFMLGLAAVLLLLQTGCAVMTFNAEGSQAKSIEMSNVNGASGHSIEKKSLGHRGFFFLFSLVPLHVPKVSEAIGPVDEAHSLKITTEDDIIDWGIGMVQSLVGIPGFLAVDSRSVVIKAEVKE